MTAEQIKEDLKRDLPASKYRLQFFNHLVRFYGGAKTPRELLAIAVERDLLKERETYAAIDDRCEYNQIYTLEYGHQYRECLGEGKKRFIALKALHSFISDCRSDEERDFYLSIPPKELVALYKAEQIEIYGEEELTDYMVWFAPWED